MRVLLDETPCPMVADSVSAAIAAASALAEKRGRMIVEVLVDGQAWTGERLDPAAVNMNNSAAQEVRLISADRFELVGQAFHDASRSLSDADALQHKAAELLQSDDFPAAMERLHEAISIWLSVQQILLMGLELAQMDVDDQAIPGQSPAVDGEVSPSPTFKQMIDQLNGHLRNMQQALQGQDLVALADILMFELPPVVRQWQDLLDDLESRIAGRSEEA